MLLEMRKFTTSNVHVSIDTLVLCMVTSETVIAVPTLLVALIETSVKQCND